MAIGFRIHVAGLQALRKQQIDFFGWPATIDESNKKLSRYLVQKINPKFVKAGSPFKPIANAYVHAVNEQTGGNMKVVGFNSAGQQFEDYVEEQIDLATDEILLKSLLALVESGEIQVPSMSDVETLTELKAKKITEDDLEGLAAGMKTLSDPKLKVGQLDPAVSIEFPNIGLMSNSDSIGSKFGEVAKDAVS
ncbi:MAG: hypothetical protein WCI55_11340 [Armatimonadota bacterium]